MSGPSSTLEVTFALIKLVKERDIGRKFKV
jgi:hypothetical protein